MFLLLAGDVVVGFVVCTAFSDDASAVRTFVTRSDVWLLDVVGGGVSVWREDAIL